MKISLIAAVAENGVIGVDNKLPWHLPNDMKYFKDKTMGHCVVMGRKNYDSIPQKFRPLEGRTNIVVTGQKNFSAPGCIVVNSIEGALAEAKTRNEAECFIIGGANIYNQTIGMADTLYYTRVHASFAGDAHFPEVDWNKWKLVAQDDLQPDDKHKYAYSFCEYEKK